MSTRNTKVKSFWEGNPVAASGIDAQPGTVEFYARFDAIREAEAKALLSRFAGHKTRLNQLSWKQLFLMPPVARALKPLLPRQSDRVIACTLGWNLYIEAMKPDNSAKA